MDAFGHVKTIGHDAGAKPLLDKAGVEPDAGVVGLDQFAKVAPEAPLGPRAQGAHARVDLFVLLASVALADPSPASWLPRFAGAR